MNEDRSWQDLLGVVVRRWRLILTVFLGGLALAVLYASSQTPVYLATAKIIVTPERARVAVSPDANEGSRIEQVTDEDLNSEVGLLKSESLVREVLEAERSEREEPPPAVQKSAIATVFDLPGIVYRTVHGLPAPDAFELQVQRTAKRLDIAPVTRSSLIEVTYADGNPERAARFVNLLVERHVERRARLSLQSDKRRFFEAQRGVLNERLLRAEQALRDFYAREQIRSGENRAAISTRLAELESELVKAETELADNGARAEHLAQAIGQYARRLPPGTAEASTPGELIRARLIDLQLKRVELLAKFAPTSTHIRDLDQQIAQARRLLAEEKKRTGGGGAINPTYQQLELELAQSQAKVAAMRARVASLREQVDRSRATLQHLDQVAATQDRLEQEVATAKAALLTYARKEEEARFSNALDESRILNLAVAEPARAPLVPERWRGLRQIAFGGAFSLLLGIGLGFGRDRLDPSVKTSAEAERLTQLPVLGEIP